MELCEKEFINDLTNELKDLSESALILAEQMSDMTLNMISVKINAYNIMRRRFELIKKVSMNIRHCRFGGK